MAVWTTPIYDRTNTDVATAKRILAQITEDGYEALSSSDKALWTAGFRGAFTYQTINRIEGNLEYLHDVLYGLGYYVPMKNIKTDWNRNDIPDITLSDKVVENTQSLIDGTYLVEGVVLPNAIDVPTIDDINAVENIHQIMYDRIDKIKNGYRYCGVTYCG